MNRLCGFLKFFDEAIKCLQIPSPKTKIEIGSTNSKDNLFAHYYNDTIEHSNRQFCLSVRFGNINSCVFSIKHLELQGNQFIHAEIVKINHRQTRHLYENQYYVANKFEIIDSIYDV